MEIGTRVKVIAIKEYVFECLYDVKAENNLVGKTGTVFELLDSSDYDKEDLDDEFPFIGIKFDNSNLYSYFYPDELKII